MHTAVFYIRTEKQHSRRIEGTNEKQAKNKTDPKNVYTKIITYLHGYIPKKILNHMHGHINRYTGTATRVAIHISTRVHTVRTVYISYARAYTQRTQVQRHGSPTLARARTSILFFYPHRKLLHGQLHHMKKKFLCARAPTDKHRNDHAIGNTLR